MHKLGIHYQYVPDWAKTVNQDWAKVIDPSSDNLFTSKPKTIARVYIQDNESNNLVMQCESGAEEFFRRCLPMYNNSRNYVYAYECVNEPPVDTYDKRIALIRFSSRWIDLMHGIGLRTIVGCWSVTWPRVENINEFAGIINKSDGWAIHEYDFPTMQERVSEKCLYYRKLVDELQRNGMIKIPPLFITECGLDDGQKHGWKTFCQNNEQCYKDQLQWYHYELCKDNYVQHAFVFTAGPQGWDDFEVTKSLAEFISQLDADDGNDGLTTQNPCEVGWNKQGIAYNPDTALYKEANRLDLGAPLSGEYELDSWIQQNYAMGILRVKKNEWDKFEIVKW